MNKSKYFDLFIVINQMFFFEEKKEDRCILEKGKFQLESPLFLHNFKLTLHH